VKHAAPPRSLARLLGRGVVFGTLWGLGITASEVLVLPFGQFESFAELGANFGQIFVNWCVDGALIACGTLALERRLDRWWKVAMAIVVAAVMAAAINSTLWAAAQWLGVAIPPQLLGESLPSWADTLYVFWMTLFYGGLFIFACVLLSRTERTRLVLGEAQMARDKTELLLDKAEIESLYGQVEPAFLIRAMRVVRDRYASDAASADQLLDDLVAFLRLAMPGVRSGSSTLAAELQLAQSYAQLQRAIDPERVAWHVDAEAPLPEMPFPPLVLLPLLDAVVTPAKAGPLTLRASLHCASQRVTLAILTPPGAARAVAVPAALRYRLRVALQATLGDGWRIADQGSDTTLPDTMALALYIDARPSAPVPAPAPPVNEPRAASLADMAAVLHEFRAASLLAPGAPR
jgi:Histidine kinase